MLKLFGTILKRIFLKRFINDGMGVVSVTIDLLQYVALVAYLLSYLGMY